MNTKAESDTLIMTLRLKSGRFESSIQVPLFGTKQQRDAFIDSWFVMMENGVRIGMEEPAK